MDALETPSTTPPLSTATMSSAGYMVRKPQMYGTILATGAVFGLVTKFALKKSNKWAIGAAVIGLGAGWLIDAKVQAKMYTPAVLK